MTDVKIVLVNTLTCKRVAKNSDHINIDSWWGGQSNLVNYSAGCQFKKKEDMQPANINKAVGETLI